MRTFGEVIAEARKKAHLTQRQLAASIKTEEGKGISGPYINDIEHNLRHPPRGYLLEQFVRELDVDVDLLYFLAKQLPIDIDMSNVSEEQAVAAYRAFRHELKRKGKGNDFGPRLVSRRYYLAERSTPALTVRWSDNPGHVQTFHLSPLQKLGTQL
jgi:transcriptional regulator with XRE-family HTH domain